ncbi:MAG: TlpA disulfide reductase family protein [Oleiphilaceae bacterium]|nr:TlpA disulfide reductase family protein [Oleiphilaceae bacterium]
MLKTFFLLYGLLFLPLSSVLAQEHFAPTFSLAELSGEREVSLNDFRGKVIYLDFWASWCGPCRQSLPALNDLHREFEGKDFEVVAINLDEEAEDALRFLSQYPVDYTVLVDRTGATPRAYELTGLPTSVLIDQRGVLVASFEGFDPAHLKKLREAIAILLQE